MFVRYKDTLLKILNVHTSVYELKMDRKPYSPTSQSESVRTSSYGSHLGQESKIGIISDVHIQIHTRIDFPQIPLVQEMSG